MSHTPNGDPRSVSEPTDVHRKHVKTYAAGVPAVAVALKRGLEQMGAVRTVQTLVKLNQRDGFKRAKAAQSGGDDLPI